VPFGDSCSHYCNAWLTLRGRQSPLLN
jgi:hypothetical protein